MNEKESLRRWGKVDHHFKNREIEEKAAAIRKQRSRDRLNERLKPCPFCGGKAYIRNVTENDGYCHYETVCVLCEDCGVQTIQKISDGYYGEHCSDEEIAEIWNRRVEDRPKGTVYFKDGHSEEIIDYHDYEDGMLIEFYTCSERYLYYGYLNAANKEANYMEHAFYKTILYTDDFGYIEGRLERCCEIDRIEIFRKE